MARKQAFSLVFDEKVEEHLDAIDKKYFSLIRTTIREQLEFEADKETRNRKPLDPPTDWGATWEIRFGPGNRFRVFYRIDDERREVRVLAIGIKERNRLTIGGEEVEL